MCFFYHKNKTALMISFYLNKTSLCRNMTTNVAISSQIGYLHTYTYIFKHLISLFLSCIYIYSFQLLLMAAADPSLSTNRSQQKDIKNEYGLNIVCWTVSNDFQKSDTC